MSLWCRLGMAATLTGALLHAKPLEPGVALPPIEGETLSGRKIRINDFAVGRPAVIVMGFSRAAGDPSLEWSSRLLRDFANAELAVFSVPVLEFVPRMARSLVPGGMRRPIPAYQHDRCVLLFKDERSWKERVGYQRPEISYVIVVDRRGRVIEVTRGLFTESEYEQVRERIRELINEL
jgi:hypothetical protein